MADWENKSVSSYKFHEKFKVGDIITRCTPNGRRNGRPLLITAIGRKRFLFMDMGLNRDERVATIRNYGVLWEHWDESRRPDDQYRYILEADKKKWGINADTNR